MNNTEKIFELLQKKELSHDENELLQQIISTDREANTFYETYLKTGEVVKKISHPDLTELAEYVLYKNGNDLDESEIVSRIPEIENHLRSCNVCSEELKLLNTEYSDVDQFLNSELSQAGNQLSPQLQYQPEAIKKFSVFKYAYLSAAAAVILYLGLFIASGSFTTTSKQLAAIEKDTDYYVTRGRLTDHFQESLKSLEAGDYKSAINSLKADISENPNDETVFYSYYILGLAHLETAGTNVIGLFPSYNSESANEGLTALLTSIEKNNSGKYPNITLNAYYYAAKACLMTDDIENAKKYLRTVVEEKGSKMNEARKILSELE